jgi:hypothetical protein
MQLKEETIMPSRGSEPDRAAPLELMEGRSA